MSPVGVSVGTGREGNYFNKIDTELLDKNFV